MKILLLSNKSPWPPKDGGSFATWGLIKGLIENNASVSLLAFNTSKHFTDPDLIPVDPEVKGDFHLVPHKTGISLLGLLMNLMFSEKPYTMKRFESRKFTSELTELLKNKYDIVQIEGLAMTFYLPLIRKLNTAKVVFRSHNIENSIWSQLADEEQNPFKKTYFRIIASRTKTAELKVANEFDGVITFTRQDLSWFQSSGVKKPALVNPPELFTVNRINTRIDNNSVFFIGALDWTPNINGLIWFINEVWPLVIRSKPKVSFHIAGRNPSASLSQKLSGRNIVFHGEVESSSGFISDKNVMVAPLFSGSGIRIKILEGMSLGKSIVATPLAAEGIECEDKKNIFLASGAENFAENLLLLLNNSDLRIMTGEFAIENVRKNYDILAATKNLLKFYSELA
jgi:glycosyltransferase involved in cell wall biosynthesis